MVKGRIYRRKSWRWENSGEVWGEAGRGLELEGLYAAPLASRESSKHLAHPHLQDFTHCTSKGQNEEQEDSLLQGGEFSLKLKALIRTHF